MTYRSRTAYEGPPERARNCLRRRLWLALRTSRPRPDGFEVLWSGIEPGASRGSIRQAA